GGTAQASYSGTGYDDVIISYNFGNVIDGGAGNDFIGAVEPYTYGPTDPDAITYYRGGTGADTFHIPLSGWMSPIVLVDFDPSEGDTIEFAPKSWDNFEGFSIDNGIISFDFEYGPREYVDVPDGGISLNNSYHWSASSSAPASSGVLVVEKTDSSIEVIEFPDQSSSPGVYFDGSTRAQITPYVGEQGSGSFAIEFTAETPADLSSWVPLVEGAGFNIWLEFTDTTHYKVHIENFAFNDQSIATYGWTLGPEFQSEGFTPDVDSSRYETLSETFTVGEETAILYQYNLTSGAQEIYSPNSAYTGGGIPVDDPVGAISASTGYIGGEVPAFQGYVSKVVNYDTWKLPPHASQQPLGGSEGKYFVENPDTWVADGYSTREFYDFTNVNNSSVVSDGDSWKGSYPAYFQNGSGSSVYLSSQETLATALADYLADNSATVKNYTVISDSKYSELTTSGNYYFIGDDPSTWTAELLSRYPTTESIPVPVQPIVVASDVSDADILGAIMIGDSLYAQGFEDYYISSTNYINNDNPIVYGTRHDDVITGGSGDQIFITLGGSDSVDGGVGTDTVVVNGSYANSSVSQEYVGASFSGVVRGTIDYTSSNMGSDSLGDSVYGNPSLLFYQFDTGGWNVLSSTQYAPTWGYYYGDVVDYWDSHTNPSIVDYFIWQGSDLSSNFDSSLAQIFFQNGHTYSLHLDAPVFDQESYEKNVRINWDQTAYDAWSVSNNAMGDDPSAIRWIRANEPFSDPSQITGITFNHNGTIWSGDINSDVYLNRPAKLAVEQGIIQVLQPDQSVPSWTQVVNEYGYGTINGIKVIGSTDISWGLLTGSDAITEITGALQENLSLENVELVQFTDGTYEINADGTLSPTANVDLSPNLTIVDSGSRAQFDFRDSSAGWSVFNFADSAFDSPLGFSVQPNSFVVNGSPLSQLPILQEGVDSISVYGSSGDDIYNFDVSAESFRYADVKWSPGDDLVITSGHQGSDTFDFWTLASKILVGDPSAVTGVTLDNSAGQFVLETEWGRTQGIGFTKFFDTVLNDTFIGADGASENFKFRDGGSDIVTGGKGHDRFRIEADINNANPTQLTILDLESADEISLENMGFDSTKLDQQITISSRLVEGEDYTIVSVSTDTYTQTDLLILKGGFDLLNSTYQSSGDVELEFISAIPGEVISSGITTQLVTEDLVDYSRLLVDFRDLPSSYLGSNSEGVYLNFSSDSVTAPDGTVLAAETAK
ncbi:hypothetical protein N9L29_05075, partial [Litoricolaceae bacterium]|nr:hypothetical protein [Litorivicinaceae bacterium]